MGRMNSGIAGSQLFNKNMYEIYQLIAYLNNDNDLNELVPEGALKENGEDLLYKKGNEWKLFFEKRFKIFSDMLSENRPTDPIQGQLWIDPHGDVIWYYKNGNWTPVKAALEAEYNINTFEQFLLIDEMEKGINTVIKVPENGYFEEYFLIKNANSSEITLAYDMQENCQPCVFVNGRYVAQINRTVDHASRKIKFINTLSIGDFVTVQYMRITSAPENEATENETYKIYNFSMLDQIKEEVFSIENGQNTITLSNAASERYLNVYLKGRLMSKDLYVLTNQTTLNFSTPFIVTGEEEKWDIVIVRYLMNDAVIETQDDDYISINEDQLRTQFLWPSSFYDRLFIDGAFSADYQIDNEISFTLDTLFVLLHNISALHVNPLNLSGVVKKAIKINPENSLYNLPITNVEYYGINELEGRLLLPDTKDQIHDYHTSYDGVYFNSNVLTKYKFIYCINYIFKETTGQGKLIRGVKNITDKAFIDIVPVNEDIAVFAQGLNLYQKNNETNPSAEGDFEYNPTTGNVSLDLTDDLNIGILCIPKIHYGFTTYSSESKSYSIPIPADLSNYYLLMCQGFLLIPDVDYTIDTTNQIFVIPENDMFLANGTFSYSVIDCTEADGISHYPLKELPVLCEGEEVYINVPYMDEDINSANHIQSTLDDLIVFIDGLLIAKEDMAIYDGKLYIKDLIAEQKCYALTNATNRYVYSNKVLKRFGSLEESVNHLNLYCDNKILCDFSALAQDTIPTDEGYLGEIKAYVKDWDTESITPVWYHYTGTQWEVLDSDTAESCDLLKGFIHDRNLFYILDNEQYYGKDCYYFGYRYSARFKYPLMNIFLSMYPNKTEYYTGFNGYYAPNTNSLSVYVAGIRQYPDSILEISPSKFAFNELYNFDDRHESYPILAVIERPEDGEIKSCSYQILTQADLIQGTQNIYRTKISLNPGILRVYVGGIRQPSDQIVLINKNAFYLKNMPPEGIEDALLVEVRQDYLLCEQVIKATIDQQNIYSVKHDLLSPSLIETGDTIAIYMNGLRYQGNYTIDPTINEGSIILESEKCEDIKVNDYIIFEWR